MAPRTQAGGPEPILQKEPALPTPHTGLWPPKLGEKQFVVLNPPFVVICHSSPRKLVQMGSQQCVKGVSVCGSILGTRAQGPVSMACR